MTAKIIEIFHSLQGEGVYLGEPMTFVRFYGCNLACHYCDTRYARDEARASEMPGDQVIAEVKKLAKPGEFVSLTGGEPLLWAGFIAEIGPGLKDNGLKLYLETNGTLPDELHKVLALLDAVAMDIKPPTACGKAFWGTHRHFLAAAGDKAFVKLVVAADTEAEEFQKIYKLSVAVIPTNVQMIRIDHHDVIYKNEKSKFRHVIEEIEDCNKRGQPVLVGTISVEKSEVLSSMLKRRGIRHNVLNAKYHEQEAGIIAEAGIFDADAFGAGRDDVRPRGLGDARQHPVAERLNDAAPEDDGLRVEGVD